MRVKWVEMETPFWFVLDLSTQRITGSSLWVIYFLNYKDLVKGKEMNNRDIRKNHNCTIFESKYTILSSWSWTKFKKKILAFPPFFIQICEIPFHHSSYQRGTKHKSWLKKKDKMVDCKFQQL